jgi:hypothetical protein
MASPLTARPADGSIVQTVDGFAGMFNGDPKREVVIFDLPWRDALDITLGLSGGTLLQLNNKLVTRVYGATNGATKVLLAQQSFRGDPYRTTGSSVDYYSNRDHLLARVRGHVCDSYVVTLASSVAPVPVSPADPNGVKANRFTVQAIGRGLAPSPVVDTPATLWTPGTNGAQNVNAAVVVPGAGRLHQLVATNITASDLWLALFDDGPSNPTYVVPAPGALPTAPGTGAQPRVPMLYVPPNAKGVAAWDFGSRGLWAMFGFNVFLSTDGVTFTRASVGSGALVALTAEVS